MISDRRFVLYDRQPDDRAWKENLDNPLDFGVSVAGQPWTVAGYFGKIPKLSNTKQVEQYYAGSSSWQSMLEEGKMLRTSLGICVDHVTS